MSEGKDTVTVVVRYLKDDIELQVHPEDETISDIKSRLEEKTGLAVSKQELKFTKKEIMEVYDDKNLAFYRYSGGCFMTLTEK